VLLTRNLGKLRLNFFDFSTIFKRIYKIQQFEYTIEYVLLHRGPYKELKRHNYALGLQKRPWEDLGASNWVPSPSRRRVLSDSGASGGAFGRGGGGTRPQAHLGRRANQSLGGGGSGGGAWRRPAMMAATARGDGEEGTRLGNA
jgi:hypothetical protein